MTWSENLKNRVPEYFRDESSNLATYLNVCGQILDELTTTIKEHDYYKDYKDSPTSRLGLIAKRFGFDPTAALSEDIMRGVIRDLAHVTKTRGVEASILWVFRILNWEVNIRRAWLPNPEFYDSRVKTVFPDFYAGEGIDFNEEWRGYAATARIGPEYGYQIGVQDQTYHLDDDYIFTGNLLIGETQITFDTGADPYTPAGTPAIIKTNDAAKIDYRNFLYGTTSHTQYGCYFDGTPWSTTSGDGIGLRILGERYDERFTKRTKTVVTSTPYIVVELDRSDFDQFTGSYSEGTVAERYEVADLLLNYVLDEFIRPANVKILMIVGRSYLDNKPTLTQVLQDSGTHEPEILSHSSEVSESDTSPVSGSYPQTIGSGLIVGAPTYQPINSWSVVDAPLLGELTFNEEYALGISEFVYQMDHSATTLDAGTYTSYEMVLRTPSRVRFTGVGGINIELHAKTVLGGTETLIHTVTSDVILELVDVLFLSIKSTSDFSGVDVDIKWLPQNSTINNINQTVTTVLTF